MRNKTSRAWRIFMVELWKWRKLQTESYWWSVDNGFFPWEDRGVNRKQ